MHRSSDGQNPYYLFNSKPLSHQTAMPQRLHSVLNPCQRAVGSPRNTLKNIKFVSYIACTQPPHSVPTASTQRSHNVFTASMTFSQRGSSCCSLFTARTRHAHSVVTAGTQRPHGDYIYIAFKIVLLIFLFFLSNPILQT